VAFRLNLSGKFLNRQKQLLRVAPIR